MEETKSKKGKIITIIVVVLVIALGVFVGIRYYYPYGYGVKAGELNYVVKKGVVFKTYEGKLIQQGIWSNNGSIQSNQFEFSVADEKIAQKLMQSSGKLVQLHYTEYFAAIPWRGYSRYVVDSIVSISEPTNANANTINQVIPPSQ